MENEEKTLALIETRDNYSLYITNKRLFVTLKKATWKNNLEPVADIVALGIIWGVGAAYNQRKKELQGISISFDEIDFVSLNKSRNGGELNVKSKNFWKFLKVDEEQFAKASEVLSSISELNGKIERH